MRNIGGSVGIAIMTTFLARRSQLHQNHLVEKIVPGSGETYRMLQGLKANFYTHGADTVTATRKAIASIYGMVQQHAAMHAFVEAFWIMGVVFLTMLPFLLLLQHSKPSPAPTQARRTPALLSRVEIAQDLKVSEEAAQDERHLAYH